MKNQKGLWKVILSVLVFVVMFQFGLVLYRHTNNSGQLAASPSAIKLNVSPAPVVNSLPIQEKSVVVSSIETTETSNPFLPPSPLTPSPSPTDPPNDPISSPPIYSKWHRTAQEGISESTFTQPKVVDIDGDGQKEVISALLSASDSPNCGNIIHQGIYAWDNLGNLKPGFPVLLNQLNYPTLCGYLSVVGVGDVVGDSKKEIVVATGRTATTLALGGAGVVVISSTGQIIGQMSVGTGFSDVDNWHVVLNDLNGDNKEEIIATSIRSGLLGHNDHSAIFAWKGDGTLMPGFPISTPGDRNSLFSEPTIVKLQNGSKEIVVSYDDPYASPALRQIVSYNINGTPRWVYNIDPEYYVRSRTLFSTDLEKDGLKDIIFKISSIHIGPQMFDRVVTLDENGQLEREWAANENYSSNNSGVIAADLYNTGEKEIIYGDLSRVYVTDKFGNPEPGFPRLIWEGQPTNPPTDCSLNGGPNDPPYCYLTDLGVADLNHDGKLDIYGLAFYNYRTGNVGSHYYSIFAFDSLGQSLSGFPYDLVNTQTVPPSVLHSIAILYPPTVADLDSNGKLNIVTSNGWGRIEAIGLNTLMGKMPIPEYGVDNGNTKSVR